MGNILKEDCLGLGNWLLDRNKRGRQLKKTWRTQDQKYDSFIGIKGAKVELILQIEVKQT